MATWIIFGGIVVAFFCATRYCVRKAKHGACVGCAGCSSASCSGKVKEALPPAQDEE